MEKLFLWRKGRLAFVVGGALWLIYALLTMYASQPNTYNLSALQTFLVRLTVVIPILLIWLVAVYGATRFKQYAHEIRKSPDGHALNVVTNGLIILVMSYVMQSIIGALLPYAVGSPSMNPLIFLHNHLPLLLALIAVIYIYFGSVELGRQVKTPLTSNQLLAALIPYTLATALFAVYFYTHLSHVVINGIPNFALPGKQPFFTMALPYLVAWLLSVVSIINISNYIRNVKGAIYKLALRYLIRGVVMVVAFTSLLQILTLASTALLKLALAPLLLVIYLLLVLYSLGFLLIAAGAKQLAHIEAVQ